MTVNKDTVFILTYGNLVITTSNAKLYFILRKLGWKIKISEFGELI